MAETLPHLTQLQRLSKELDKRIKRHKCVEPYYENDDDQLILPPLVSQVRMTKLYRYLMPAAEAPWGSLVVDAKGDRLEATGIRDTNKVAADAVWEAWQRNFMDSESKLGHGAALLDGRAHATVWPDDDGQPDIALDDVTQMVVEYAEGSRHRRTAALRRWQDDGQVFATLYRTDGIFKYEGPAQSANTLPASMEWSKREVEGEKWPLDNPFDGVVPVVEVPVNRRLKSGRFPHARGEFEHATGVIDRVHLLTFLGLVVALWMGFPTRVVLGEKMRREVLVDDDGNTLIDEATGKEKTQAKAPFDAHPDALAFLENPDAKLAEFKAADRKNLSVYDELQHLAVITKTPRHYFPMDGGISNIASETVNAYEGAMHAAVTGHKATMGEGWEEVLRLCGVVLKKELSPTAELVWADHEFRSLAERADAASKLKGVIPPTAVAELALNASDAQIARWQSEAAQDPLSRLVAAATTPAPPAAPAPTPALNGNAG